MRSVLFGALDPLGLGIAPAHLLSLRVKVKAVGHAQVGGDDHTPMRAVHVGALDLGRLAVPVRPEYVAVDGVNGHSAWIMQAGLDQSLSVGAAERDHLNGARLRVSKVHVATDPVYGQALG